MEILTAIMTITAIILLIVWLGWILSMVYTDIKYLWRKYKAKKKKKIAKAKAENAPNFCLYYRSSGRYQVGPALLEDEEGVVHVWRDKYVHLESDIIGVYSRDADKMIASLPVALATQTKGDVR